MSCSKLRTSWNILSPPWNNPGSLIARSRLFLCTLSCMLTFVTRIHWVCEKQLTLETLSYICYPIQFYRFFWASAPPLVKSQPGNRHRKKRFGCNEATIPLDVFFFCSILGCPCALVILCDSLKRTNCAVKMSVGRTERFRYEMK